MTLSVVIVTSPIYHHGFAFMEEQNLTIGPRITAVPVVPAGNKF